MAHDPATAAQQRQQRLTQIAQLEAQAKSWEGKLTKQDEGIKKRGHKLSDSGTKARFYHVGPAKFISLLTPPSLSL